MNIFNCYINFNNNPIYFWKILKYSFPIHKFSKKK